LDDQQVQRDWQTAAELAPGGAGGSSEGFEVSGEPLTYPPDPSFDPGLGLARAVPEGTVDLTDDVPQPVWNSGVQDSVRIPESLYRGEEVGEPVHGTVQVDQGMVPPNATVTMPVESLADERRTARARALGEVDPGADVFAAPARFLPPSTYKIFPSVVLLVARLFVVAILSIRATQELLGWDATKFKWTNTVLAYPDVWAIAIIAVGYLTALLLLLGLGTRAAGVGMAAIFIMHLVFLIWGVTSPFMSGIVGFSGEFAVAMVIIGLLFVGVGGGGVTIDATIHRSRLERKNARLSSLPLEESA